MDKQLRLLEMVVVLFINNIITDRERTKFFKKIKSQNPPKVTK